MAAKAVSRTHGSAGSYVGTSSMRCPHVMPSLRRVSVRVTRGRRRETQLASKLLVGSTGDGMGARVWEREGDERGAGGEHGGMQRALRELRAEYLVVCGQSKSGAAAAKKPRQALDTRVEVRVALPRHESGDGVYSCGETAASWAVHDGPPHRPPSDQTLDFGRVRAFLRGW
jgi:hypothetical protein